MLVETLQLEGIPATQVLASTGMSPAHLTDPGFRVSGRQLLTVLARCALLSRDPAFALRYRALATPLLGLQARESDSDLCWSSVYRHGLGENNELYRLACEIQFATQLSLHRDVMGAEIRPIEVRAAYPAPPHAALYETLLGCPVHFNAHATEISFDVKWLEQPIALGHPIPSGLIRETCDRLLAYLQPATGAASQVCVLLLVQPGRFPDIEELAQRLGMSSRTLRRKLLVEGTTYQQLLAGVRHRLATDYLSTTKLNTEDVAASLGFSDAANFRQAFKRWTGRRPSDFRPQTLRRAPPAA